MIKNDVRLNNLFDLVRRKDRFKVRKYIISLCRVSVSTYYKWLNGTSTPTIKRREIINGVAYLFGYDKVYTNDKGYNEQSKILSYELPKRAGASKRSKRKAAQ